MIIVNLEELVVKQIIFIEMNSVGELFPCLQLLSRIWRSGIAFAGITSLFYVLTGSSLYLEYTLLLPKLTNITE